MLTEQQALALYDLGCARGDIINGKPERLQAAQKLALTIIARFNGSEPWPLYTKPERERFAEIMRGGAPKPPGLLGF